MESIWILIIAVVAWIFIQVYLLPKLGIST